MKKVVLALVILVAVAFAAGRGYGGFTLSYVRPDVSNLNSEFTSNGLPALDCEIITYGGCAWGSIKHLTVGGWGFGGSRKFENQNYTVRMVYDGGFFEPGYFIDIYRGFGIKPSFGIGGTGVHLTLRPKLGEVEFDSLLVDPGRTSEIIYGTATFVPSLAILVPIKFIALEIKGGYMWSPIRSEWDLKDGAQLRNPPDINLSGLYVCAGLLFGGAID